MHSRLVARKTFRKGSITKDIEEALRILQEEAAEVIQAASKVLRAGPEFIATGSAENMYEKFVTELGDYQALVNELKNRGFITQSQIDEAAERKSYKLYKWTRYLGVKKCVVADPPIKYEISYFNKDDIEVAKE